MENNTKTIWIIGATDKDVIQYLCPENHGWAERNHGKFITRCPDCEKSYYIDIFKYHQKNVFVKLYFRFKWWWSEVKSYFKELFENIDDEIKSRRK